MPTHINDATRMAEKARAITRKESGAKRTKLTKRLSHRIYAQAHRLHIGSHEIVAIFEDGSILRILPGIIRSLRLQEKHDLIAEIQDEAGHIPRTPGHNLPYLRLQKTCINLLDKPKTETQKPQTVSVKSDYRSIENKTKLNAEKAGEYRE